MFCEYNLYWEESKPLSLLIPLYWVGIAPLKCYPCVVDTSCIYVNLATYCQYFHYKIKMEILCQSIFQIVLSFWHKAAEAISILS